MNMPAKFEYVKFIPVTSAEKMAKKNNYRHEKLLENQLKCLDNEERYSKNVLDKNNITTKNSIGKFYVDVRKCITYKNYNKNGEEQYVQLNRGKILDNRNDKRFRPTMMSSSSSNRLFHPDNINAHNSNSIHKRLVRAASDSVYQVGHKKLSSASRKTQSFSNDTEDGFYPLRTFGGSARSIPDFYQDSIRPRSSSVEEQKHARSKSSKPVNKQVVERTPTPALPGISLDKVTESQLKSIRRKAPLSRTSGQDLILAEPLEGSKIMHKSSSYTDDRTSNVKPRIVHRPLSRSYTLPTNTGLTEIKEVTAAERELLEKSENMSIQNVEEGKEKESSRLFTRSLTRDRHLPTKSIRLPANTIHESNYEDLMRLRQSFSESELTRQLSADRSVKNKEQMNLLRPTKSNDV